MGSETLPTTDRTTLKRLAERGSFRRREIYDILDEGLLCHVGFQGENGPFVLPMAYARRGDTLLLHGSVGSRLVRHLAGGAPACVTVTLVDGLVLARSAFHHSMNYRSVVIFGSVRRITDEDEKRTALDTLVEHLVPGRTADARRPSESELRATEVLALPIAEASAKTRTGPPGDEPDDMNTKIWAGVIPLALTASPPIPDTKLQPGIPTPPYASSYRRPK